MPPVNKTKAITDATIEELSLVFAHKDGLEYAPRNPNARVLAVKSGEASAERSSFLGKVFEKLKKGWLVEDGVPDNIDGDGDGAQDYEQICSLLTGVYYDLSQCYGIMDNGARSVAICTAIDNFLERLDDIRSGGDGQDHTCFACGADKAAEKAGARHSAADRARLDKIADHAAAIAELHGELTGEPAKDATDGNKNADDKTGGDGTGSTDENPGKGGNDKTSVPDDDSKNARTAANAKAGEVDETDKAKKKDDKPYGDVEYADAKNNKYPIDTKEHAKAAWSYINQEKNAAEYSASELKTIKDKIKAACEKFGVEISEDKAAPIAEEDEMKPEELKALMADVAKAAAAEAVAAVKSEMQPALDAAQAEAQQAAADKQAAEQQAAAAQAEAETAKAAAKSLGAQATAPSAASAAGIAAGGESRLMKVVKAQMSLHRESDVI